MKNHLHSLPFEMERQKWLSKLAQEILVKFIWPKPQQNEIRIACSQQEGESKPDNVQLIADMDDSTDEEEDGCRCEENTGEDMVRCVNYECGWFHYSNVQLEEVHEDDWWCSDHLLLSYQDRTGRCYDTVCVAGQLYSK